MSAEEIKSSKLTNHSLVQEIKSAKKKQEEIELEFFKLLQEKEASKKAQCELNTEVFKLKEELERIYKEKESLSASLECSNAKNEELPFSTGCCRARMFHECMSNVLTRCFTT
jgi:hypothetical protein